MDGDGRSNGSSARHVASLLHLDWNPTAVPINGFLMPLIAVATVVNNALVVAVLMQIRSPTNALLAALAVSDTLTVVSPVPCFVHFYTVGRRYLDWVPYSWCFAYFALTDYLPTVFHTASIWLTTSLAAQRYVYVCCSVQSTVRRRLCTMRGTVVVIVAVYAAAVASHVCRLGELTFRPVRVASLLNYSDVDAARTASTTVEVTACAYELTSLVARHETLYFSVYYWSRVLLIHVIPCSALVFLNSSLVRTMRAAHQRRCQMTSRRRLAAPASRRQTITVTDAPASEYEMQPLTSLPYAVSYTHLTLPTILRV